MTEKSLIKLMTQVQNGTTTPSEAAKKIQHKLSKYITTCNTLSESLFFYANPDTYFAIGFVPDPPCGDFINDFDNTGKPGSNARKTLRKLNLLDITI